MAFNFQNIKQEMEGFFTAWIRFHSNRKLSFDYIFFLSSVFIHFHSGAQAEPPPPHMSLSHPSPFQLLCISFHLHISSLSIILFLLLFFTSSTYASTATLNFLCMKDLFRCEEITVLIINKKALLKCVDRDSIDLLWSLLCCDL